MDLSCKPTKTLYGVSHAIQISIASNVNLDSGVFCVDRSLIALTIINKWVVYCNKECLDI